MTTTTWESRRCCQAGFAAALDVSRHGLEHPKSSISGVCRLHRCHHRHDAPAGKKLNRRGTGGWEDLLEIPADQRGNPPTPEQLALLQEQVLNSPDCHARLHIAWQVCRRQWMVILSTLSCAMLGQKSSDNDR